MNDVLSRGRRAVITVQTQAVAHAIGWLARLPEPYGLGFDENRVKVVTGSDLSRLEPDEDCIVPHAFDPHDVFSSLSKAGPRAITVILLQNESAVRGGALSCGQEGRSRTSPSRTGYSARSVIK